MRIDGAIALVTGGAGALGLEIARDLQKRGATVVISDISETALAPLQGAFDARIADATDPQAAHALAAAICADHGRLDILVNCAGAITSRPLVDVMNPRQMMHSYEEFRRTLALNLDSVFIMTAAVVEQMVRKRVRGVIVNISSISAQGNAGQTAYSAAKAGVEAMTRTWAKELGGLGIRCNAVAPGFIGTDSTAKALPDHAIKHIVSNTPLRRLGRAEEVAQAVAAVVENEFVNGMVTHVDGGLTL